MARSYLAFFCLALLAAVNAQDESFDATVVKAEGTPEVPVVEFDKLPEDVKKIVEQKLSEQGQGQATIAIPEDRVSDELKQDLAELVQMKDPNMIPFDLLTPDAKDKVIEALENQEAERAAERTVANYESMSDDEKAKVRALFRAAGNEQTDSLAQTAAALGGGVLGGLIAGAVGLPGSAGYYQAYPYPGYNGYQGAYGYPMPGGQYHNGGYYPGAVPGQGHYPGQGHPGHHHGGHGHHHGGYGQNYGGYGQNYGGYGQNYGGYGQYQIGQGHYYGGGINRPVAQRPHANPVAFRMSPHAGSQGYPHNPAGFGYNPYSTFFRRPAYPQQPYYAAPFNPYYPYHPQSYYPYY